MAGTSKLFPTVLRRIPTLWTSVHDTVENLAKATRIPILHITDFQQEVRVTKAINRQEYG